MIADIWQQNPKLLIVTGELGAGKTTWVRHFIDYAYHQQAEVCGLLSPAIFEGGVKTGIGLVNLTTGEQRQLARLRTQNTPGIATKRWTFDEEVLAWGNAILRDITQADLLIIDELGPLELEQGTGWQSALTLLDTDTLYNRACVVIRPSLIPIALARWPHAVKIEP
jgi:nucleoside-triphosphatase